MLLARVVGNLYATRKDPAVETAKLLLLSPVDHENQPGERFLAAVDTVGAGEGDMVLYTTAYEAVLPWQDLSGRSGPALIDASVIAVVDRVDRAGKGS